jgi:hypothetical protein
MDYLLGHKKAAGQQPTQAADDLSIESKQTERKTIAVGRRAIRRRRLNSSPSRLRLVLSRSPALPRTTRPDDARFRRTAAIFPATSPRTPPPPLPLFHTGYSFPVNTILGFERLAEAKQPSRTPPR